MQNRLHTLSAFAFAFVAVTVSGTAVHNSFSPQEVALIPTIEGYSLLGQSVPSQPMPTQEHKIPEDGFAILPANTHNFVECENTHSQYFIQDEGLLINTRFWIYEFTGDEPPFNGDFLISDAEIEINPDLRYINTLQNFQDDKRYYIMSEKDLYLSCTEGIRSTNAATFTDTTYATSYLPITGLPVQMLRFRVETDRATALDYMAFNQKVYFEDDVYQESFFTTVSLRVDTDHDGKWDIILPIEQDHRQSNDRPVTEIGLDTDYLIDNDEPVYFEIWGEEINPSIVDNVESGEEMSVSFSFPEAEMWERGYYIELNDDYSPVEGENNWNVDGTCYGENDVISSEECFNFLTTKDPLVRPVRMQIAICGDGQVDREEECDNGGNDGCDNECRVAIGYRCSGEPSRCTLLIPNLPGEPSECEETDGGNDAFVKGVTTEDGTAAEDYCVANNVVSEFFCSSGFLDNVQIDCQYGCDDGACAREGSSSSASSTASADTCSDTDGGDNEFERGTATIGDNSGADFCLDDNQIAEYSCGFGFLETQNIYCEFGCDNGACARDRGPEDDAVSIHSVTLDRDDNLEIIYSKNFDTCAHIYNRSGTFDQRINFICEKGEENTASTNQSDFNDKLEVGEEIKICHGNNGNICSDFIEITGNSNVSTIIDIENANPDANGSAVPTGVSSFGQFIFSTSGPSVKVDKVIFSVNATNVAMDAQQFKAYNKSDSSQSIACSPYYLSGDPFTATNISGSFYIECDVRNIPISNNSILVLSGDILNPTIASAAGGVSTLQASIQSFTDSSASYGFDGNHIQYTTDGQTFNFVDLPYSSVNSTSYNS